jgi:hypothetical protein
MTAIGGLWVLIGFRQYGLLFDKASRGESSYSFIARLRSLLDSVTSFSQVPLYGVFFLGLTIFFMASLVTIVLIVWMSILASRWRPIEETVTSLAQGSMFDVRRPPSVPRALRLRGHRDLDDYRVAGR